MAEPFGNQFRDSRFVERNIPFFQTGDALVIVVHTDDAHPEFREASPGDQSDIAGPNDADLHE